MRLGFLLRNKDKILSSENPSADDEGNGFMRQTRR